jgi:hypothetical protein
MKLLLLFGILLGVPSGIAFVWLLQVGGRSYLLFLSSIGMYAGLAVALYATAMLFTND